MSDATVLMASPTVGCFLICGGLCATACAADTISPIADVVGAGAAYTSAGGK
ncbi:hypothetical protein [Cellulosilyticum ruminicola]|uniref:hypothetical protein n=1 Tax=Cellulosilyticum ruminicola TaxID=425254 RepID=UPI0012EE6987|nr:hypothetical protein [Cellulosilyticum ruminicola]